MLQDPLAAGVRRGIVVLQVWTVCLVTLVIEDQLDHRDRLDQLVLQEMQDRQEQVVKEVRLDQRDPSAKPDPQ